MQRTVIEQQQNIFLKKGGTDISANLSQHYPNTHSHSNTHTHRYTHTVIIVVRLRFKILREHKGVQSFGSVWIKSYKKLFRKSPAIVSLPLSSALHL